MSAAIASRYPRLFCVLIRIAIARKKPRQANPGLRWMFKTLKAKTQRPTISDMHKSIPNPANNGDITALCKIIKDRDMYQYLSYKSRIEKLKKSLGIQASKLCIFEEIGIW